MFSTNSKEKLMLTKYQNKTLTQLDQHSRKKPSLQKLLKQNLLPLLVFAIGLLTSLVTTML
jgi:hypothetical protein